MPIVFFQNTSKFFHQILDQSLGGAEKPSANVIYALIFQRIVGNYNACLSLGLNGFVYETCMVIRSMYEAMFRLTAFIDDPAFMKEVFEAQPTEALKLARKAEKLGLSVSVDIPKLQEMAEQEKVKEIEIIEIARKANLENIYNHIYSQLCVDVHVNMMSLEKDCCWDESTQVFKGVVVKPPFNEMCLDFIAASDLLVNLSEQWLTKFGVLHKFHQQRRELLEQSKVNASAYVPVEMSSAAL